MGEGPGKQEDHLGFPFIGRSGDFLSDRLAEHKYSMNDVWITNLVRCRSTDLEDYSLRDTAPSIVSTIACQPWLSQEIQIINPKVILCLGGPAANSILRSKKTVSALRGRWHTDNLFPPTVVRVSYHPAYILRLRGEEYDQRKADFSEDLRLAIEESRKRLAQC